MVYPFRRAYSVAAFILPRESKRQDVRIPLAVGVPIHFSPACLLLTNSHSRVRLFEIEGSDFPKLLPEIPA